MSRDFGPSKRLETYHPLFVSAEAGNLPGCSTRENCRLWGAGILRFTDGTPEYSATLILTTAGCEACSEPHVTQGDIGAKAHYEGTIETTREAAITDLRGVAEAKLAEITQGFLPPSPSEVK